MDGSRFVRIAGGPLAKPIGRDTLARVTDLATTSAADRDRTRDEEWANMVTHGIGFALSLLGAAVLLFAAFSQGGPWQILGCTVYAATLVATYGASTMSHAIAHPAARHAFRTADQALIFLFIAGSYTPVACAWLRGGHWWILHAMVWAVALFGFSSKALFNHRVHLGAVSAWLYLALGWLPVMAGPAIVAAMPVGLFPWMVGGGVCYTLGLVFFYLDHRYPYFHAAWHILVIAGSACHYFGVLFYCTAPAA
jgi:hemolysin III